MFDFLFRKRTRQYGDINHPGQERKVRNTEANHIAPSGQDYPFIREQLLAPGEIEEYIVRVRKTAVSLGISDYEVWRKETPDGPVVTYGTKNSLDQACMLIRINGNEAGRWSQGYTFNNGESPREMRNWIDAARKLLDENGISYDVRQTAKDKVEFVFDSSANLSAFTVAIDNGLVDRISKGENTAAEFTGLRSSISSHSNRARRFDMN